jgi:hypothetical protein
MSYAELIETLQHLPEEKQAEVFDFAKFLAQRFTLQADPAKTLAESSLAELMHHPAPVHDFKPFNREEANAR